METENVVEFGPQLVALEAQLRTRQSDLFGTAGSIVLYDMTNTHFEGLCKKNAKARHGKTKQNIALLKERGLGHIINITRHTRSRHAEAFESGGFESVPACHLLSWIRETLRSAGETRDWKTLRRLLSTLKTCPKPSRLCSAFRTPPLVLCPFLDFDKKLGIGHGGKSSRTELLLQKI